RHPTIERYLMCRRVREFDPPEAVPTWPKRPGHMHVERVEQRAIEETGIGRQDRGASGGYVASHRVGVELCERLRRPEHEEDRGLRSIDGEGVALDRRRRCAH